MSYNKNTVNISEVEATLDVLKTNNIAHELTVIGIVDDHGINSEGVKHQLFRLRYNTVVLLEQMQRTKDCDGDDMIVSYKFPLASEPKMWDTEVGLDFDLEKE